MKISQPNLPGNLIVTVVVRMEQLIHIRVTALATIELVTSMPSVCELLTLSSPLLPIRLSG